VGLLSEGGAGVGWIGVETASVDLTDEDWVDKALTGAVCQMSVALCAAEDAGLASVGRTGVDVLDVEMFENDANLAVPLAGVEALIDAEECSTGAGSMGVDSAAEKIGNTVFVTVTVVGEGMYSVTVLVRVR
jgi:hypothetical protein